MREEIKQILSEVEFSRNENKNVITKKEIIDLAKTVLSELEKAEEGAVEVKTKGYFTDLIDLIRDYIQLNQEGNEEYHELLSKILAELAKFGSKFEEIGKPLEELNKEIKEAKLSENLKNIYKRFDESLKLSKSYVKEHEKGTFLGIYKAFTRKFTELRKDEGRGLISATLKSFKTAIKEGIFGLKEHEQVLTKQGLKKAALGSSGVFLKTLGFTTGDLPLIFGGEFLHKKAFEVGESQSILEKSREKIGEILDKKLEDISKKGFREETEFVRQKLSFSKEDRTGVLRKTEEKPQIGLISRKIDEREIKEELEQVKQSFTDKHVVTKLDSIEKRLEEQNKILKATLDFEKEVEQDRELSAKKEKKEIELLAKKEGAPERKETKEVIEKQRGGLLGELRGIKDVWNWFKGTKIGEKLAESRIFKVLSSVKDKVLEEIFAGKGKLFEIGENLLGKGRGALSGLISKISSFMKEGSLLEKGMTLLRGGLGKTTSVIGGLVSKGGSLLGKLPGLGRLGSIAGGAEALAGAAGAAETGALVGSGVLASAGSAAIGVLSKAALPLLIAKGAFDAFKGWKHAAEITGKKEGELKWYHKLGAATSSVLSGLTLGLIDAKSIYKFGEKATGLLKKAAEYSPFGLMFKGIKKFGSWLFGSKEKEKGELETKKTEIEKQKINVGRKEEKAELKEKGELREKEKTDKFVIFKIFSPVQFKEIAAKLFGEKEAEKLATKARDVFASEKVIVGKVKREEKDYRKVGEKLVKEEEKGTLFEKLVSKLPSIVAGATPFGAIMAPKMIADTIKEREREYRVSLQGEHEIIKKDDLLNKVMERFMFSPTASVIKEQAKMEVEKKEVSDKSLTFPYPYTSERSKFHPEVVVGDTSFLSVLGKMIAVSV